MNTYIPPIYGIWGINPNCKDQSLDFAYKSCLYFYIADSVRNQEKGKVLVHCQAGVSRSATICLAYVMSHKCLNMEQAFEFVKSRRTVISPNVNFLRQLLEFEKNIPCSKPNTVVNKSPVSPCRMFSVNRNNLDLDQSSGFSKSIGQDLPSPFLTSSPVSMVASPVVTSS